MSGSLEQTPRLGPRSRSRSKAEIRSLVAAALAGALLLALGSSCTSAADIRAAQEEAWDELQLEADKLFASITQVADERELPVARRDDERRRLTTEWMLGHADDPPEVRRRYFLAVFVHPGRGMALHARIDREAPTGDGVDSPIFEPYPPDEVVSAEQDAIVERAYEIYQSVD